MHRSVNRLVAALLLLVAGACARADASAGVLGDWRDPTGSVIRIGQCGTHVCLWVASLSPTAPTEADIHNPDPGQRHRALCGLEIGGGFALRGPRHAFGGLLYDPKSGKTYHGAMSAEGERLELRGYVGVPFFGESQTWTRVQAPASSCAGLGPGN